MRIYTCYTPSHRRLLEEHFVPSLKGRLGVDGFNTSKLLPQESTTGAFQSDGFQTTCLAKVGYILEVLAANLGGEPFIFSDVDVRFYGDPTADLMQLLGRERHSLPGESVSDILFQDDGPAGACTGFMVMRPTPRVLEYWRKVAEWMRDTNQLDQDAANRLLETHFAPAWGLLPERYWTVGRKGVAWKAGDPVAPPADLMVHHANWTVGIEHKLKLLEAVIAQHLKDTGGLPTDWLERGFQRHPERRLHADDLVPPAIESRPRCIDIPRFSAIDAVLGRDPVIGVTIPETPPRKEIPAGAILTGMVEETDEAGTRTIGTFEVPKPVRADQSAKERISQAVKNIDAHRPVVAPAAPKLPAKAMPAAERYPFGATHARRILDEQMDQDAAAKAIPDCLAIVLQFWSGDKDRAMALARLIADIEPEWRDDVYMVFARQSATPMDDDIRKTMAYVGHKMGYVPMEVTVDEKKTYPGIAFDPWASAMQKVSDAYYSGKLPCANALMIESDACPLSPDWIDRIKEAHTHTLELGKRITGPRMTFGGRQHWHVNGTFVCHYSLWPDRPSLHRCHPRLAWDVFLGEVLLAEAGPSQIIRNEYGCTNISAEVFLSMAKESALLVSVKDYSAIGHAMSLLVHRGK